ncbi:unnamed protein product [Clonostachys byssicola]|uniref:NAD(P)-binding domain-containing protein n=1 Tax=Clonostachys byssicola TaxID=160290 RepID=A0A9N9Y3W6_9HYPO|nr:unnamed protein product [Clonostachys byssicola]
MALSTYAILGATGHCGKAMIEVILQDPDTRIHAYCRNKPKLLKALPHLADHRQVEIFEGSIQDVDLLARCMKGTKAVVHAVSTNTNVPKYTVGFETAQSIIAALEKLKADDPNTRLPKLLLLSSAMTDKQLSQNINKIFGHIMHTAASYVYDDLDKTEAYLRKHEDLVTTIYIKPGGLSVDIQRGHKISLTEQETFVSYLDLAAAMKEAADDPDGRYDGKAVSVVNANTPARFPPGTFWCIVTGLIRHFLPFTHPYLPTPGPE